MSRAASWPRLDGERVLFVALLLLHLVPIWSVAHVPSQDGPSHLANAAVLRHYRNPALPVLRQYYELNPSLAPNWLGHLLLAALLLVATPPVAEKLLLSGAVLLLPLAARRALAAVAPEARFLAVLAFPLTYTYFLHMGFHNFVLSQGLLLLVLGYTIRHAGGLGPREAVTLGALTLLLYLAHPVSLVAAWLGLGVLTLAFAPGDLAGTERPAWRAAGPRVALVLTALAPSLLLTAAFLSPLALRRLPGPPPGARAARLLRLEALVSFRDTEVWLWTAIGALFALLLLVRVAARLRRPGLDHGDGLAALALAYLGLYLLAPEGLSFNVPTSPAPAVVGSGLVDRLALFPFFALLLWLGSHPFGAWPRRAIQVAGAALAGLLLGVHLATYVDLNRYLDEFLSGEALIEPNRTLLPLVFSARGHTPDGRLLAARIGVFRHAAGYLAAGRGVVDLDNYEATVGVFPTRFRPALNPFVHIGRGANVEAEPPGVEFLGYHARTGGQVDYVLVWNVRPEQREDPATREIGRQLAAAYELIHASRPHGLMQLYRRRSAAG